MSSQVMICHDLECYQLMDVSKNWIMYVRTTCICVKVVYIYIYIHCMPSLWVGTSSTEMVLFVLDMTASSIISHSSAEAQVRNPIESLCLAVSC